MGNDCYVLGFLACNYWCRFVFVVVTDHGRDQIVIIVDVVEKMYCRLSKGHFIIASNFINAKNKIIVTKHQQTQVKKDGILFLSNVLNNLL